MDLLASCAAIEGATSSRAVVEELEAVCDALGGLEQAEDRPRGLREIATTLVSERITAHRSSAVRLWAACCVCDVLRIYAPHAPYSNGELVAGFQVITEQLTRLGAEVPNATLTERCTYILDSLREFQSSCALVGLYHQDESALTALVDFVDAVIYSAREDGSDSARESAAEVLSTVLSECEPLPNELMERLLLGLTPAARKRNARAHWVVQQAMRERYEGLARPVAAYLRGTLSLTLAAPASESAPRRRARVGDSDGGDSDGGDSDGGSDASGESSGWAAAPAVSEFDVNNVYALVYEFHLVEPRMLLYILPLATERLRCDALATREKVVTLFAKLFAATHYDYAEQYREHYVEWLKRFRDTEPVMRARMVSLALKVIETRPQLRSDLLRHVARSFDDTAVDVRQQAVRLSCDFMLQIAPRGLDDASGGADWDCIIEKLYERTRDKRAEIRKEALTGLVQLYRAHVSDRWASANLPAAGGRQQRSVSAWDVADDDDEPDDDDDDNAAPAKGRRGRGGDLLDAAARATLAAASATGVAARRLQRVPELAIVSYASACNAGDVRDRARVLLDERLFNSKASAPARAAALLASVMPAIDPDASGSAHAQLSLAMLLKFQGVAQAKVQAYIGAHLAASADGADAAAAAGLDAAHTNLALLVYSRTGGKTTLPRELSKVKDRKMLRMLAVAVDCTAAREARLRAARDVGERVGAAGGRKNDDVKAFGLGLVSVCNDVLVDAFSLRVALQLGAHKLLRQQGRAEAVQEEDDDIVIRGCIALADIVAKNHPRLLAAAGLDTVSLYAAAAAAACDAESFKHAALALAAAACAQVAAGEAQLTLSAKDPDEDAMAALRCVAAAEDPQGSSRLDDDDVFFAACSKDAVAAIAAVTKSANDPDARGAEVERLYAALRCDESASWTYGTALPVLVARLRSLCRLVTHFADDFDGRPGAHDLIEEIDSALIASSPMLDGDTPDDSAYGAAADDSAFSYAFLALRAAVKLGAYHAIAASHAPQGRRRPQDAEWHRRRVERSLEVLFGILESGGSAPCGAATTSSEKAELRLTAASTALKLATRGGARLSVERWRALAYVALDADATVRFGFLRKLANAVRQGDAGMIKWGSVLCLAAIDFDQAPGDDAPRAGVKARRHDDEDDDDDDDEPPKRRPKKKGAAPDRRAAAAEERRESKKEHAAAVAACRKAATAARRRVEPKTDDQRGPSLPRRSGSMRS
ncbi:hypothetical protein M885DRAFT_517061 [Pelagophyceae sp. CCMP2097]|nr:hypothetical protein M885DRAFT_517061 [Pelagophyceae sp. CCMP2097]